METGQRAARIQSGNFRAFVQPGIKRKVFAVSSDGNLSECSVPRGLERCAGGEAAVAKPSDGKLLVQRR